MDVAILTDETRYETRAAAPFRSSLSSVNNKINFFMALVSKAGEVRFLAYLLLLCVYI